MVTPGALPILPPPAKRPRRTLRRDQIARLICQGHVLVLHRRTVYRLNAWLTHHPGGALAILHFVGRDAADELEAYHPPETISRMRAFAIADLDERDWDIGSGWTPLIPPVQLGWPERAAHYAKVPPLNASTFSRLDEPLADHLASLHAPRLDQRSLEPGRPLPAIDPKEQHDLSLAYRKLHDDIIAAGLYEPRPFWRYRFELIRYFLLFAGFLWSYLGATRPWHVLLSATFFGFFWHQVTFTVHDLGHMGVTGTFAGDRIIGTLLADLVGGLSVGWWADNHNIHHLVTNHPEHDPDIQHLPFFAISSRFLTDNLFSTYYRRLLKFDAASSVFVSIQHRLYYLVMSLARVNLFVQSYTFLATKARRDKYLLLEVMCIMGFWWWFSALLRGIDQGNWARFGFVAVSFICASPVHVQIVLSHFGQDTTDMGVYESFAHRQLRTTMDVSCPEWLEFVHGGLNMQVTHHLFPRLPRHSLKEASLFVRHFCAEQGLSYRIHGFVEGNKGVLAVLRSVADQARVLRDVARAQANGDVH